MKIFVFADGLIGLEVIKFLKKRKENIVGIAIHPKKYQNLTNEIVKIYKTNNIIICNKKISKKNIEYIKELKPDVILVAYWRFLLDRKLLDIPKFGCINFHMSFLPFNRGANPNIWSIIENTPAGCTIHRIDEKIDNGNIICQKKTNHNILDTGETLYFKILKDFKKMFINNWDLMKKKKFQGKKQNAKKGSIHFRKELVKVSKINMKKMYYPIEIFNILRAKIFKPHNPAYFIHKKKKYFVNIKIKKASEK
jgi:methionyl-tRNA formyltransferase